MDEPPDGSGAHACEPCVAEPESPSSPVSPLALQAESEAMEARKGGTTPRGTSGSEDEGADEFPEFGGGRACSKASTLHSSNNSERRSLSKSSFIRTSSQNSLHTERTGPRAMARQVLGHPYAEFISGMVVLVDFVSICGDTDAQAAGRSSAVAGMAMNYYCSELALRFFGHGMVALYNKTVVLDLFVICVSIFEYSLVFLKSWRGGSSLIMVRMIRLCRLLRLVRVVKVFSGLTELRRLMQMITTCARTMFWSFLMCFLWMSMWAVLAVELVHPVAQRIAEGPAWQDCERCSRAFESVMAANLTFFQTILAGDEWGIIAIPLIEESPLTAFVFCGSLLTLTYGIMQLITAVIVDSFADMRKMDVNSLASEMTQEEKLEKEMLARIFEAIDVDGSGQVTYDELAMGAHTSKEFQNWLRVMDVDASDLERLFVILDGDGNGEVDLSEFMDALYRMKNAESKTTTKFVKHTVESLEKKTTEMFERFEIIQSVGDDVRSVQLQLQQITSGLPGKSDQELRLEDVEAAVHRASEVALEAALSVVVDKIRMLPAAFSDRGDHSTKTLLTDTTTSGDVSPDLSPTYESSDAGFETDSSGAAPSKRYLQQQCPVKGPCEHPSSVECVPLTATDDAAVSGACKSAPHRLPQQQRSQRSRPELVPSTSVTKQLRVDLNDASLAPVLPLEACGSRTLPPGMEPPQLESPTRGAQQRSERRRVPPALPPWAGFLQLTGSVERL
eukprot:TRINITY_DN5130_c0_g1_i9.p1 TRINITY_DN5130_c0_g1~~TRINITY_DN5130_c0_g1_i9.p1  ORF type:complete len:732 (-),score=152.16 TRINITY_DN5130_c0_g1_i9:98-2293(-)